MAISSVNEPKEFGSFDTQQPIMTSAAVARIPIATAGDKLYIVA